MQTQSPRLAGDHLTNPSRPDREGASALLQGSAARQPPNLRRRLKNLSKRGLRTLFEFGQHFGVDLLPRHFYSEIPNIGELRRDGDWKRPRSMVGVNGTDADVQFDFVESCCTLDLISRLRRNDIFRDACRANGEPGFSAIDADFLFGFLQTARPKRIVQVGCGVSTAVLLLAAREMADFQPEIVCVEPYPTRFLKEAHKAGEIRLVEEKAQVVNQDVLTDLGEGGFLFVDSTHAVRPGSEVNRLVTEILPRLKPGNWVHFHDIYFPYDYQRGLLDDELFFSNESILLHAFLINNAQWTIRASLSMLHYSSPSRLGRLPAELSPREQRPGTSQIGRAFPCLDLPSIALIAVRGRPLKNRGHPR